MKICFIPPLFNDEQTFNCKGMTEMSSCHDLLEMF